MTQQKLKTKVQDPDCPNCGVDALFYREGNEEKNIASCAECSQWEGQPALIMTDAKLSRLACYVVGVSQVDERFALEALVLDPRQGHDQKGVALNVNEKNGRDYDAVSSIGFSWVATANLRDYLGRVAAAKQPARVKAKTFASMESEEYKLTVKPTKEGIVVKENAYEVVLSLTQVVKLEAFLTRVLDAVDLRAGLSYKAVG